MIQILKALADGVADDIKVDANHPLGFDLYDFSYIGSFMGERKIIATFESAQKVVFNIGEKVLFRGHYFYLQNKPLAQRVYNSQMITYTITFQSVEYELGLITFQDQFLDDPSQYQHTGNLEVFVAESTVDNLMKRIISNTQRAMPNIAAGWEWSYEICQNNPETMGLINLEKSYEVIDGYCSDALELVKSVYGLDYVIYKDGKRKISIGYPPIVAQDELAENVFEFGYDLGICEINRLQNDAPIITRAIGFGSDRNIPLGYRESDKIYSQRLMLPEATGGYLDDVAGIALYGIREGICPTNDDIYPSIDGYEWNGKPADEVISVNPLSEEVNGTNVVTTPAWTEKVVSTDKCYVGQYYQGGIVFYVYPDSNGQRGLIVTEYDVSASVWYESLSGGDPYTTGANGTLIGTGLTNHNILLAHPRAQNYAVKAANDYSINGYSDWWFPNLGEMQQLYSVSFQTGVYRTMVNKTYWTSSEVTGLADWKQAFCIPWNTGVAVNRDKNNSYAVRAIREFDNTGTKLIEHPAETKIVSTNEPVTASFQVNDPGFSVFDPGIQGSTAPKISFTSGQMQGKEFKILKFDKVLNPDGTWTNGLYKVTIERDLTDPAHPYPAFSSDIAPLDTFVYLDIIQPYSYVESAEIRLQAYVQSWLDEQFRSYQGFAVKLTEEWIKTNPTVEDYIRDGNAMRLKDDELNDVIPNPNYDDILIQSLSINYKKEEQLPTYDVTLSPTPITSTVSKLKKDLKTAQSQVNVQNIITNNLIQGAAVETYNLERRILTTEGDLIGYNIAPQTLQLKSASLTTRDTNYVLTAYLQVNYLGDENQANGTAGTLFHKDGDLIWGDTFDDAHQTWTIPAPQSFTLESAKGYWAYVKGSMVDGSAEWVISETRLGVYEYDNYFMFEWGQINPVVDGYRYVQSQYGTNGISSYVYVAYASDDIGTDFTLIPDPLLTHIAILSTTSQLSPPVVGDFVGLWFDRSGGGIVIGDWTEDQVFEYKDIEAGTIQTYTLDPKASYAYDILNVSLEVDNGTMTGIAVKINGTAITSLSAITADTTIDTTVATALYHVSIGDRVTLVTAVGYTGTPQILIGKIDKKRT